MNKKLQKYIDLSLALYEEDAAVRCQHISIATYKNRIISVAKNSQKTTPVNLKNRKFGRDGEDISGIKGTCSEWACLRKVKRTTNIPFDKIALYVVRVNNNRQISMSAPCVSCRSLVSFLGVSEVNYTNDLGEFERL